MFPRKRRNKSGTISVVLVSKAHGDYKEVMNLGVVKSEIEADALLMKARDSLRQYGGQQELDFILSHYQYGLTAADVTARMTALYTEKGSKAQSRYHKTGKGDYAEGDKFIGLNRAKVRTIVKDIKGNIGADEIGKMLASEWHEVRMCGFLLIVEMMNEALPKRRKAGDAKRRQEVADFYLAHARETAGWDIIDNTAPQVIGAWLLYPDEDGLMPNRSVLDRLAKSDNLWEQRIAIVSTQALIKAGQLKDTFRIAQKLRHHSHDLIHKAVGWMLREAGKKDISALRKFLEKFAFSMPRTMLRYAIEKLPKEERTKWMAR